MNRLTCEGWSERAGKGSHVVFPKPGFPNEATDIVPQAQDALASLNMYPPVTGMPRAIEDGAPLPTDLSGFEQHAFVVVVPLAHTKEAKATA
jgi:hypothetical protein